MAILEGSSYGFPMQLNDSRLETLFESTNKKKVGRGLLACNFIKSRDGNQNSPDLLKEMSQFVICFMNYTFIIRYSNLNVLSFLLNLTFILRSQSTYYI